MSPYQPYQVRAVGNGGCRPEIQATEDEASSCHIITNRGGKCNSFNLIRGIPPFTLYMSSQHSFSVSPEVAVCSNNYLLLSCSVEDNSVTVGMNLWPIGVTKVIKVYTCLSISCGRSRTKGWSGSVVDVASISIES